MGKVTLSHPILGKRTFDKDHAERILAYNGGKNGGWEPLPEPKAEKKKDVSDSQRDKGDVSQPKE